MTFFLDTAGSRSATITQFNSVYYSWPGSATVGNVLTITGGAGSSGSPYTLAWNSGGGTDVDPYVNLNGTTPITGTGSGDTTQDLQSTTGNSNWLTTATNASGSPGLIGRRATSATVNGSSGLIDTTARFLLLTVGEGWDGTQYGVGAAIAFKTDGSAWTTSNHQAHIEFYTTANGTAPAVGTLTFQMRSDGVFEHSRATVGSVVTGGAATLGNTGGGPASGTQVIWLKQIINGQVYWLPAWQ